MSFRTPRFTTANEPLQMQTHGHYSLGHELGAPSWRLWSIFFQYSLKKGGQPLTCQASPLRDSKPPLFRSWKTWRTYLLQTIVNPRHTAKHCAQQALCSACHQWSHECKAVNAKLTAVRYSMLAYNCRSVFPERHFSLTGGRPAR